MPLIGNNEGLVPAFNVYLANMPQDFYNLISHNYIKEMTENGFEDLAKNLLMEDAEYCGINTFGGILSSEDWKALIAPMLKTPEDTVFGLIAVANGLGWGRMSIKKHIANEELIIDSTS
jgi:hypothetical protein